MGLVSQQKACWKACDARLPHELVLPQFGTIYIIYIWPRLWSKAIYTQQSPIDSWGARIDSSNSLFRVPSVWPSPNWIVFIPSSKVWEECSLSAMISSQKSTSNQKSNLKGPIGLSNCGGMMNNSGLNQQFLATSENWNSHFLRLRRVADNCDLLRIIACVVAHVFFTQN